MWSWKYEKGPVAFWWWSWKRVNSWCYFLHNDDIWLLQMNFLRESHDLFHHMKERGMKHDLSFVVVWYKFCFDFQQCIFPFVELDTSTSILFSLKLLPPKIELQLKVLKPLLGLYFILHSLSFLHNIINFLLVNVTSGFKPIISPSTNSCGMRKWYLSQSSLDWHDYHLLQNVACCCFH